MPANRLRKAAPWAGWVAGPAGVALNQQILADQLYWDCRTGGPGMGMLVGAGCALLIVLGGWTSWRTRNVDEGCGRFAGSLGAWGAGFFLLALSFQTLAAFIVPGCRA